MSEIFVYVEGPSDQLALRELLADIIHQARNNGHGVDFYPLYGKEALLNKGPKKAINILRNRSDAYVFVVPDLYPRNTPFTHLTFDELKEELEKRFARDLQRKGCDDRLAERFFVHCFKYDLETLILASEEALLARLRKEKFSQSWSDPVEDQNHDRPPKRIVEALFREAGMRYKDTVDAPWVLGRSDYGAIVKRCPQNFAPFVRDLMKILELPQSAVDQR